MMGKSHVISGVGLAVGVGFGGIRYGLRHSEIFYNFVMPVLYNLSGFLAPRNLYAAFRTGLWVLFGLAFLFGTLVPDIDHPRSLLGRYLHMPWMKHHGFMHSIWPVLFLIFVGCLHISLRFFICVAAGAFTHLLMDSVSALGVNLFYPIRTRHRIALYTTGEITEYIFLSFVMAVSLLCLFAGFFL